MKTTVVYSKRLRDVPMLLVPECPCCSKQHVFRIFRMDADGKREIERVDGTYSPTMPPIPLVPAGAGLADAIGSLGIDSLASAVPVVGGLAAIGALVAIVFLRKKRKRSEQVCKEGTRKEQGFTTSCFDVRSLMRNLLRLSCSQMIYDPGS